MICRFIALNSIRIEFCSGRVRRQPVCIQVGIIGQHQVYDITQMYARHAHEDLDQSIGHDHFDHLPRAFDWESTG